MCIRDRLSTAISTYGEIDFENVNKDQAQKESALLNSAIKDVKTSFCWDDVLELSACIKAKGQIPRQSGAITLYNSHRVAIEDVALATKAFDLANEQGVGSFVEFTGA